MTSQTTKIRNGSLVLPKAISELWRGADVFLWANNDSIYVKRVSPSRMTFSEMADALQKAAKRAGITKKDVAEAITETRRELYGK